MNCFQTFFNDVNLSLFTLISYFEVENFLLIFEVELLLETFSEKATRQPFLQISVEELISLNKYCT